MDEITRTLKTLFLLLQHMNMAEEDGTSEIEERLEAIKCELGSWFIDEYQLYQGS
jgi:NTP pyrophosphatase (non-canonical NTP hydrolase)